MINGERTFLVSGTMHYFRIPSELWEDRLEKARQFGLNCIETYVAWNIHEPEEGVFGFEGNADLERFIVLARKFGMYVICRPGPYICAEWDFGGFPSWLLQKKGIVPRRTNAVYLKYVRRWFDRLLPRLRRHLITAGGPILMMQVENELANIVLEDDERISYMDELAGMFRAHGIDVPYISCEGGLDGGLECINAHDPAERFCGIPLQVSGTPARLDGILAFMVLDLGQGQTGARTNAGASRACDLEDSFPRRGRLQLLHVARGANFGYRSMYLQTTSYFNDAPLNESGLFNECGRRTRRIARFVAAMGEVLADSETIDGLRGTDNRMSWENIDPALAVHTQSARRRNLLYRERGIGAEDSPCPVCGQDARSRGSIRRMSPDHPQSSVGTRSYDRFPFGDLIF